MTNGLPCVKYAGVQRELGTLKARANEHEGDIKMLSERHLEDAKETRRTIGAIDRKLTKMGVIVSIAWALMLGAAYAAIRSVMTP